MTIANEKYNGKLTVKIADSGPVMGGGDKVTYRHVTIYMQFDQLNKLELSRTEYVESVTLEPDRLV